MKHSPTTIVRILLCSVIACIIITIYYAITNFTHNDNSSGSNETKITTNIPSSPPSSFVVVSKTTITSDINQNVSDIHNTRTFSSFQSEDSNKNHREKYSEIFPLGNNNTAAAVSSANSNHLDNLIIPTIETNFTTDSFVAKAKFSRKNRAVGRARSKMSAIKFSNCVFPLTSSQFQLATKLLSVLPDPKPSPILTKASSFTPSLHPNIDIVRPPSLVFATNDSHTDHIVAIWDMFVREKTLTIIFARYMESYGCGLYDQVNITISTSLVSSKSKLTQIVQCNMKRHNYIDIFEESRYDPLLNPEVSVDAVRICTINILPSWLIRKAIQVNHVTVTVNYLGFTKTFPAMKPIERAYPHSYGANVTDSQLVVNTMLGDKPRHSMTTLITWLRYHHRLGVQQVFVYLMQPVQWLIPAEEVRELNEYISSLESAGGSRLRLTFVDWPALYMKLPSYIVPKYSIGCSHLAIIQSNLYRMKQPFYSLTDKYIVGNGNRWMLECDIDDYLIPPPLATSIHTPLLTYLLTKTYLNSIVAIEFHNRYFYLLSPSTPNKILEIVLQSNPLDNRLKKEVHRYILPSLNYTLSDLLSATLIVETDKTLHKYRPKLIYNVEEVMLGGPHRIDVSRVGGKVLQNAGYYLHLLQGVSIGRDIDMIERPGKTSLKELTDKTIIW